MDTLTIMFRLYHDNWGEIIAPTIPRPFCISLALLERWEQRGVFEPKMEVGGNFVTATWKGTGLYAFSQDLPIEEVRALRIAQFADLADYLTELYKSAHLRRHPAKHIQTRWQEVNRWRLNLEAEQDDADLFGESAERETFTASLEALAETNQTDPEIIEAAWLVYYSPHHPKLDRIAEVFELSKADVTLQCCIDFFVVSETNSET